MLSNNIELIDSKFPVFDTVSYELIDHKIQKKVVDVINRFHSHNLYDTSFEEVIESLSEFKYVENDKDAGGYCNHIRKVVAITRIEYAYHIEGFKMTPKRHNWKTFTHELAHALQAELELFEKLQGLFSEELFIEWQAESMSYLLYNGFFPNDKLPYYVFNSYFNLGDVNFLNDWYHESLQNDIKMK